MPQFQVKYIDLWLVKEIKIVWSWWQFIGLEYFELLIHRNSL